MFEQKVLRSPCLNEQYCAMLKACCDPVWLESLRDSSTGQLKSVKYLIALQTRLKPYAATVTSNTQSVKNQAQLTNANVCIRNAN